MFKYVDKILEWKSDYGYHFKVEFLAENKLRRTSLKERTDWSPLSDEETYYINQQAENIFTISWVEASGLAVSENLDFDKMTVYAFIPVNEPSARGGRFALKQRGSFSFIG